MSQAPATDPAAAAAPPKAESQLKCCFCLKVPMGMFILAAIEMLNILNGILAVVAGIGYISNAPASMDDASADAINASITIGNTTVNATANTSTRLLQTTNLGNGNSINF